jgi:hypothetical protein
MFNRFLDPKYHRGALIVGILLVAALTLVIGLSVFYGGGDHRTEAMVRVFGFGGLVIGQLFLILRGERTATTAEETKQKVEQNTAITGETKDAITNGVLDARVQTAVSRAMEKPCGEVEALKFDISREVHQMKHDLLNISQQVSLLAQEARMERQEGKADPPPGAGR